MRHQSRLLVNIVAILQMNFDVANGAGSYADKIFFLLVYDLLYLFSVSCCIRLAVMYFFFFAIIKKKGLSELI